MLVPQAPVQPVHVAVPTGSSYSIPHEGAFHAPSGRGNALPDFLQEPVKLVIFNQFAGTEYDDYLIANVAIAKAVMDVKDSFLLAGNLEGQLPERLVQEVSYHGTICHQLDVLHRKVCSAETHPSLVCEGNTASSIMLELLWLIKLRCL